MKNSNKIIIAGVIVLLVIFVGPKLISGEGKYDEFAKCLSDNGAKMYGAFWCSHCEAQKKELGASFKHINYIECSNSDRSQNQVCSQAGISAYPTWEFADGSRVEGQISLELLSLTTNCPLE